MKKTAMILCMVPVLFSCGKSEEVFLFEKGSKNHNAAAAVMAEKCKSDNKKLLDNLDKTSSFANLFASGQNERVFKFSRKRSSTDEENSSGDIKDGASVDKASIDFNQYIRIVKPTVEGDDMLVQFASSKNLPTWGTEQESKIFYYSQANNKELQNEIINGVCGNKYSASIKSSKTQLKFSGKRVVTKKVEIDGKDVDQIQKQVKETFILDSGYPLFFYRLNGSTQRVDRASDTIVTKVEFTTPKIDELKAVELIKCRENADGYEKCSEVLNEDNIQKCDFNITPSHAASEDPDTYLTHFTGCTSN